MGRSLVYSSLTNDNDYIIKSLYVLIDRMDSFDVPIPLMTALGAQAMLHIQLSSINTSTAEFLKGNFPDFGEFGLILSISINRYDHVRTVSSPDHSFSLASLTKRLTSTSCIYFRL